MELNLVTIVLLSLLALALYFVGMAAVFLRDTYLKAGMSIAMLGAALALILSVVALVRTDHVMFFPIVFALWICALVVLSVFARLLVRKMHRATWAHA